MAQVDRAVRIRRAVGEHEGRPALGDAARILSYRPLRSHAASIAGSRLARSAFIGKPVFGKLIVLFVVSHNPPSTRARAPAPHRFSFAPIIASKESNFTSSRSFATNSTSIKRPYRSPAKSNTCTSSKGSVPFTVGRVPRLATPGSGRDVDAVHPHRQDAPHRRFAPHEAQIRRRKSQRAAQAAGHAPRGPIIRYGRPSKRAAPAIIRALQPLAHRRAAHAHPVEHERAPSARRRSPCAWPAARRLSMVPQALLP